MIYKYIVFLLICIAALSTHPAHCHATPPSYILKPQLVQATSTAMQLDTCTAANLVYSGTPGHAFDLLIPHDSGNLNLRLLPHTVRSIDFSARELSSNGQETVLSPGTAKTYRGVCSEHPDAIVVGSLLSDGFHGRVMWEDATQGDLIILPLMGVIPEASPGDYVVYNSSDYLGTQPGICGSPAITNQLGLTPDCTGVVSNGPGFVSSVRLVCDTDPEFTGLFANSEAARDRIEQVFNEVNGHYARSGIAIVHLICDIVIRTGGATYDVVETSNTSGDDLFNLLDAEWTPPPGSLVGYDGVHLFSGKSQLNVLRTNGTTGELEIRPILGLGSNATMCFAPQDTLSLSINPSQSLDNRAVTVSHELGHNWSAVHCDCSNNIMNASLAAGAIDFSSESAAAIMDHLHCAQANGLCLGAASTVISALPVANDFTAGRYPVALAGDLFAAAAPSFNEVSIYRKVGFGWALEDTLTTQDFIDMGIDPSRVIGMGTSIALGDDVIFVRNSLDGVVLNGGIFVIERNQNTGRWDILQPEIEVSASADPGERLTFAMAIDGTNAAVRYRPNSQGGTIIGMFSPEANGSWERRDLLNDTPHPPGDDFAGAASDVFGDNIDINGDFMIIGDLTEPTSTSNIPDRKVRVLKRTPGGGFILWRTVGLPLEPPSGVAKTEWYGYSVAVDASAYDKISDSGVVAYVGSPAGFPLTAFNENGDIINITDGAVYVYRLAGSSWSYIGIITHPTLYDESPFLCNMEDPTLTDRGNTRFGESIDADNGRLLVTALDGDIPARTGASCSEIFNRAGEAFLYDLGAIRAGGGLRTSFFSFRINPQSNSILRDFGTRAMLSEENICVVQTPTQGTVDSHLYTDLFFTPAPPPPPVCFGDCDGNGTVNFADLVAMLFRFGTPINGDEDLCNPSMDEGIHDEINFGDLVATLFLFGDCPASQSLAEQTTTNSASSTVAEMPAHCTEILSRTGFASFNDYVQHVQSLDESGQVGESLRLVATAIEVTETSQSQADAPE